MSLSTLSRERLRELPRHKLLALAELKRRGVDPAKFLATDRFTEYADRPVAFAREVLGVEPWERQAAIMEALAREPRVTVRSCHNSGKTYCAALLALWFLQTRPGSIVVTTAPSGRQVRELLWRRIRGAFSGAREPLVGRCLTTNIDCGEEWYATGFATDEQVKFQGPHSAAGVLVIGDEASGLAEWLYEAIDGIMTQEGAKLLLIGNPNHNAGGFYESHKRWPAEQRFHISAFDVPPPILRPDWKDEMLDKYGEESPVYQVRVEGNFPTQGSSSLINMVWVDAAQNRTLEEGRPLEMGVDIARFGDCESVAYVRAGPKVVDAEYWRGNDLMQSAGRVAALQERWRCSRIKVDAIGIGAGVCDRLKELGLPVVAVNVSAAAVNKEKFANLRAEIFVGMADRFREGNIEIPLADTELRDQLMSLTVGYTSRGQQQLVAKEELRRKGLPSPDRADALALCLAGRVDGDAPTPGTGGVFVAAGRGWMDRPASRERGSGNGNGGANGGGRKYY